jgi:selenide,water dikinase
MNALDDAGIYKLNDDLAIVQSVDFFTPIVDEPRDYGAISAANALSDLYAMGAEPFAALSLVAFPQGLLPLETLAEILNGAQDVLREAGVALLGGHSVQNREPLIGFAVTGRVRPDEILSKQGGQPGDRLVLTKPLGTGILATGLRSGKLDPEHVGAMTSCMKRLNRDALAVAKGFSIHAATDVTGFGLLGHLHEMAVLSGVRAVVDPGAIRFLPGTEEMAREKQFAGGLTNNRNHLSSFLVLTEDEDSWPMVALFDPQTSGGLLFAVAADQGDALVSALRDENIDAFPVGALEEGRAGEIEVRAAH